MAINLAELNYEAKLFYKLPFCSAITNAFYVYFLDVVSYPTPRNEFICQNIYV